MATIDHGTGLQAARHPPGILRWAFAPLAGLTDAATILGASAATGIAWHLWVYGDAGPVRNVFVFGGLIALFFGALATARGEYAIPNFLTLKRQPKRVLYLWGATFLAVAAVGFLTRSGEMFSRGAVVALFVVGFAALVAGRALLVRLVRAATRAGKVAARRVLVVGPDGAVVDFARRVQPWTLGMQVVGTAPLDDRPERLDRDLARAAALARVLRPDDVMLVLPWSAAATIERAVDAFLTIPVSIRLAPERILDRFDHVAIARVGTMASLELSSQPLSAAEVLGKRLFDIAAAAVALVLLAPLFLAVALLIRWDSPGPVFFMQRRFGFNQRPFRILKFRSMTAADDGDAVPQARRNDPRITRVGAFLRRSNIDELPQLVNVLLGHMSIVGPRPHAVAHDQAFGERIALYARRHNVKPGITGWAQVNGLRGETDTEDKMRRRVEHDLWYIDNWSFLLDVEICVRTFLSPKAFRNAR